MSTSPQLRISSDKAVDVQSKRPSCKVVYFCQMIDVFFRLYNPPPSRPKTPFTHVVYSYNDIQLSKGHLGSRGGGASENKLKDTSFHLFNGKHYNFKYKSYACAEGILQSFGNEVIYILNNLQLLFFENL